MVEFSLKRHQEIEAGSVRQDLLAVELHMEIESVNLLAFLLIDQRSRRLSPQKCLLLSTNTMAFPERLKLE